MNRNFIRTVTGMLTLLTVGGSVLSCGQTTSAENETANTETAAVTEAAAVTETETTYPLPNLPETDFGGIEFTLLTSGSEDLNGPAWETYDVFAAAADGDVITDAVYARNMWIEETFNIKIAEIKSDGLTLSIAKNAVQAGETVYDAMMTNLQYACLLGRDGFLYDIKSIPHIDLSAQWWDQRQVEDMTIADKLYIATGDITVIDNDATWVLMFNKQMALDYDLDNLYELVRSDQWTIDRMHDMAKNATRDVNGDGKIYAWDDNYGFLTTADTAPGLLYASGLKLSSRDENGYPTLETDLDKMASVVTTAAALMGDRSITCLAGQDDTKSTDDIRVFFQEGKGLFFGEVLQCVTRMRESTTDFGLLPWPKYDEAQAHYHNFIHGTAGKGITVLATQTDLEKTGIVLEAMAARAISTITPAYYDVALTYKYMRDEESAEMLDIILDSRVYDLAYIYDWGQICSSVTSLIQSGKTEFASTWEKKLKLANQLLGKTVDAYIENT